MSYTFTGVDDDFVEMKVIADVNGQKCINDFCYRLTTYTGSITLADFINAFIGEWQLNVIPVLGTNYTVKTYDARVLSKNCYVPYIAGAIPILLGLRKRYLGIEKVAGVPANDTGTVAGDQLPAMVAVGYAKVSSGPQLVTHLGGDNDHAPVGVGAEKIFRGGVRLSGIPETYTTAAAGDDLTAAAIATLSPAMDAFLEVQPVNGANQANFNLVIESTRYNGIPRLTVPTLDVGTAQKPAYQATLAFQDVESFLMNSLITSQVSRKKTATSQ